MNGVEYPGETARSDFDAIRGEVFRPALAMSDRSARSALAITALSSRPPASESSRRLGEVVKPGVVTEKLFEVFKVAAVSGGSEAMYGIRRSRNAARRKDASGVESMA